MKKSDKPAPAITAMVIYDDLVGALLDKELLIYEEELDKKENFELSLVPQACEFSTSGHANCKCNMKYDVSPTVQHSTK
eukprot:10651790-Ditylum_brightwellii.AAC.1